MLMDKADPHTKVSVSMKMEKLVELMEMGVLCGADLHVSDPQAKALIQQACLKSCAQKLCKDCEMSDLCGVDMAACPSKRLQKAVVHFAPHALN